MQFCAAIESETQPFHAKSYLNVLFNWLNMENIY